MSPLFDKAAILLFRVMKFEVRLFPRKIDLFLGRFLGNCIYFLDRRHRRVAHKNIVIALGGSLPIPSMKKMARASFLHFGEVFMDLIKFSVLSAEKQNSLLTISGESHLKEAAKGGRGILVVTAHYGNWEIGIIGLSKIGTVNVVARALDVEPLERELYKLRTGFGAKIIYKDQATRQVLRALRNKEIVALLIDQNVLREQAIFVDFFGKQAATTPALAAFHLRTKAPIIPAFCYPTREQAYRLELFKPVEVSLTDDYEADVITITQKCTKVIEDRIRQDPRYWLWFHDRWRTQP